ncbi:NADH dehydrogenase (quinone) [Denitrovibrio acetiphilus DSM 12809]|uniref:NADH dehydrogenase (Quinone) n=1 Tax=Denitrovibrio acetiphilus (strain DSM 12809 / NBRC 114555 / N2460) TaxID=522772 RepID=D4H174_DENA2|nr:NADH-quinone oxidoreductase subunit NuoF [Denitrovibrio acetiphilus]ADD66822.1 NADH dehydrogenase (quinone) [Denitrovibrio acetiphilus DSM 12809]
MNEFKTDHVEVHVCMGTAGVASGAIEVMAALDEQFEKHGLKNAESKERNCEAKQTGCRGLCARDVLIDVYMPGEKSITYEHVTAEMVPTIVEEHIIGGQVVEKWAAKADYFQFYDKQKRYVLHDCGRVDPESLEDYVKLGGYEAIKKAITMKPEEVIEEVKASGLRGRGGGGFPTGLKWTFCRGAKTEDHKYLICNADEGDPGAFMDRSIIEGNPHAVIEGMLIAGYAIGCDEGYIYCRAEYPLAIERVIKAIKDAEAAGYLGKGVFSSDYNFKLKLKEGAGAFVCGEETALIASIEGERGMPRPRPPFPAVRGLWQKPSNVNNVETFANLPNIILKGSGWYSGIGTEKSKGTKIFALSGKIKSSGLVEVPMGITVRELIFDVGGGIPKKRKFKAVQLGGPSGGCLTPDHLETPIDYDSLIAAGAMMGSGGVVVMDETNCMVNVAQFFLTFTQRESCGKCIPCRIGTKTMLDILDRITTGKGREGDIELLQQIGEDIKTSSLCGLGQTAPNPVLTTIKYFRHEYEAHIKDKKCPARECAELIEFVVVNERCKKCGLCKKACPVDAITWEKKQFAVIDNEKCVKCRECIVNCPFNAID